MPTFNDETLQERYQREALEMAVNLEKAAAFPAYPRADYAGAAANLRRLSEVEAELAAIKALPVVAWMHVMDSTEGLPENTPWETLSFEEENPFGVPGEDYSEEYPVFSTPLYALPQQTKDGS